MKNKLSRSELRKQRITNAVYRAVSDTTFTKTDTNTIYRAGSNKATIIQQFRDGVSIEQIVGGLFNNLEKQVIKEAARLKTYRPEKKVKNRFSDPKIIENELTEVWVAIEQIQSKIDYLFNRLGLDLKQAA